MTGSPLNERTVRELGNAIGLSIEDGYISQVTEVLQGELENIHILDHFLWTFDHTEVEAATVFDATWDSRNHSGPFPM